MTLSVFRSIKDLNQNTEAQPNADNLEVPDEIDADREYDEIVAVIEGPDAVYGEDRDSYVKGLYQVMIPLLCR